MKTGSIYLGNNKTQFTIWAPLKEKVRLHIVHPFDQYFNMHKDREGYFSTVLEAKPGCQYFFVPENENDIPDPASAFQPQDVHGPSEVIDHGSYKWDDDMWKGIPFNELILYELHTATYTNEGTFEAIISKLDHIAETGINAIELMPIAQFPGARNWGYDGVYPYAVQYTYGGPEGLKKLVDACHRKGIAVFLDVVYNHLGPEGNYLEAFAPYFTDQYKTPWGKAINFDGPWSDGVREFFSDNAVYWFEHFHIDGLRFDAIHGIYDNGAIHFWQLMHEKIKKAEQRLGKQFYTIAESDLNNPKVVKDTSVNGYGFTAQWLDDFHHALYILLDKERGRKLYADFGEIQQLAKAYKDGFVHSGEYVNFRKRKYGTSSAGIDGENFVAFIDNHDQAGNRVSGERLASLISFEKIKLASAGLLLSPYIPMLFMGEEYGEDAPFFYFISHTDNNLIKAVQEGRKKEFEHFGWDVEPSDPQHEDTFLQSKLQWNKLDENKHQVILKWYKQLIGLRKTHAALQNFSKDDIWVNTAEDMLILHRRSGVSQKHLMAIFNFSETKSLSYSVPSAFSAWSKIIDSNDGQWIFDKLNNKTSPASIHGKTQITIAPLSMAVYENA